MNKARVRGVRNVGLSLLALAFLVIAAANIPAEYSLPAMLDSNADAAHNGSEQSQPTIGSFESGWRYTKSGWQKLSDWERPAPVSKPALHPVVVGSMQLLVSLAALIAFSARRG
ncbi:MAG: hypothetical protein JXM70_17285 [Pirellulales bacterium]|nr:hypothetical protein [Pirellulales bacterium]